MIQKILVLSKLSGAQDICLLEVKMRLEWLKRPFNSVFTKLIAVMLVSGSLLVIVISAISWHGFRENRRIFFQNNLAQYGAYLVRDLQENLNLEYARELSQRLFLIIRFEDLITQPEVIAKKICIFLNLKYDSAMVNPEQYVNGSGKPWKQNTSFGPGKKQFDHSALTRWKNVLSERECAFIEMLCWPEMQLHNYQLTYNNLDPVDFSLMPPKISDKDLAIWIKEIFPNDTISNSTEIIKEQLRYNLLKIDINKFSDIEPSLIEASFLFQSLFKEVKFSL
jgi:hypothetical protein